MSAPPHDPNPNKGKAAAIIIFDLKGQSTLFHAVRIAAERRGRAVKLFTISSTPPPPATQQDD